MKQRNIKISLISFIVVILIIIITQSCGNHNAFCVKTISGEGEDTTYSIINRRSNATVYEGGNNPIQLDSIIDGNYIFIENIVTEECSDRIIDLHLNLCMIQNFLFAFVCNVDNLHL